MGNESVTFLELILLNLYLGSIVFIICTFLFFCLIKRKMDLKVTVFIIASQLCDSILLSMVLWVLWPFKGDVVCGFIFFPALFSEIGTVILTLCVLKLIKKSRRKTLKSK